MHSRDAVLAGDGALLGLTILVQSCYLDRHQVSALLMKVLLAFADALDHGSWFVASPTDLCLGLTYRGHLDAAGKLLSNIDFLLRL